MSILVRVLAEDSGLTPHDVRRILLSAPKRYKTFQIEKRSGGKRTISQPAREVKLLQRIFASRFLLQLPVHSCAKAYIKGTSILSNAQPHAGHGRPILKMDFKDFFPSLKSSDWVSYCSESNVNFSIEDLELSSRLLFTTVSGAHGLRLAIGAPTSPMLSNILMFGLDRKISEFCITEQVTYTRYADDLTFSAARTGYLTGVTKTVKKLIRDASYPRLEINQEKTVYATAKYQRSVTGLVLSNDGRVTIGREKKRHLHACVHRAAMGELRPYELQRLGGMLAYVMSVEPAFIDKLFQKYGAEVLLSLKHQMFLRREVTQSIVDQTHADNSSGASQKVR